MIIEVTGTSTRNKGAELMLVAIREYFLDRPDVQLAVDQFFGTYEERAQYQLLQKVNLNGWGRSRLAVSLMPREFQNAFGLVRDEDVDVLLDASGFAFGDQHPKERTTRFADRVEAAKQAGKTVILLPQALGPFEQPEISDAFARIVEAADLVFARDDVSMEHARQAAGTHNHLHQAPDFTNVVKPQLSGHSDSSTRASIVPNQRMIEQAESDESAEAYVPLMGKCIDAVEGAGLDPVLVVHGHEDVELARAIQQQVRDDLRFLEESDPVALKRFLGESHLVIGSRFHALVGALSQGVPAIGTSWSHKYEMLFQEYGCESMVLPVRAREEQIREKVTAATGEGRSELTKQIRTNAEALQKKTESMWKQVDDALSLDSVMP